MCSAGMCPESVSGREVSKCAVQTCAQKVWWASVQCSHVPRKCVRQGGEQVWSAIMCPESVVGKCAVQSCVPL